MRDNLSQTGSMNTDSMARALLQHRNTPCAITGLSPAQILFGRVLRDFLPLQPGKFFPRQEWRQAAETREAAYSKRVMDKARDLSLLTKSLPRLSLGQQVLIQDQDKASRTYKQWTRTGVVIEAGRYDDYKIRVDGSRIITKRNRQFLRPIQLESDVFSPKDKSKPQDPWSMQPYISSPKQSPTTIVTDPKSDAASPASSYESHTIPQDTHKTVTAPETSSAPEDVSTPTTTAPEASPNYQPIPSLKLHRHPENGWYLAPQSVSPQFVTPLLDSSPPSMCSNCVKPPYSFPCAPMSCYSPGPITSSGFTMVPNPQSYQVPLKSSGYAVPLVPGSPMSRGSLTHLVSATSHPTQVVQSGGTVHGKYQSGRVSSPNTVCPPLASDVLPACSSVQMLNYSS